MPELTVMGWFARRPPSTRWHLIESQIEDRLVTKCGRQLKLVLHDVEVIQVAQVLAHAVCRYCS